MAFKIVFYHSIMNNLLLNKLARMIAVVVFLIALAINIKVTLDDPFLMLTEGVLAQISDSDGSITSSSSSKDDDGETLDVRQGYSWRKQADLATTSYTETDTTSFKIGSEISFDSRGGMSLNFGGETITESSASKTTTYNWIDCCNPSNSDSACNFGSENKHHNCVTY